MIQIKNAAELQKMRKACAISAAALKAGGEAIEPGITTAEIDKIIYDFIVRHGARPNFLHLYGFPATACISVNDTVIHGIPNKQQQIRPGDIVSIDTGCKIDIDDDGTIHIAAADASACDAAKKCIDDIVFVPEIGKLYYGRVVRLMTFGAFVELAPGKDGLVHISKLADHRIEKVEDACKYAVECDSTGAAMAKVASTEGAIGYVSLDVLDDSVNALKLDEVEPTSDNIVAGTYFLCRPFVMATKGEISEQSELVQAFFDFVKSDEGKAVIKAVGLITAE